MVSLIEKEYIPRYQSRYFEDEPKKNLIDADLQCFAHDFLKHRSEANNLLEIINQLKIYLKQQKRSNKEELGDTEIPLNVNIVSYILTVKVIFEVMFRRREIHLKMDSEHKIDYDKDENHQSRRGSSESADNADDIISRKEKKKKAVNSMTKYRIWLRECYEESLDLMLQALEYAYTSDIIEHALASYMRLVCEETKAQLNGDCAEKDEDETQMEIFAMGESNNKGSLGNKRFPLMRLKDLLMRLASSDKSQMQQINVFCTEYAKYSDVLWHTWSLLQLPLLTWRTSIRNDTSALNVITLLQKLPPPPDNSVTSGEDTTYLFCPLLSSFPDETSEKQMRNKQWRRIVNRIWRNIMSWTNVEDSLSTQLHKGMVLLLVEQFLMHLDNPKKVTDFLIDSMDVGGSTAVIALQGIYTLVQRHNITYPQLYGKLYNLFTPRIFEMRSKKRLYRLADIFLKSTHLSEKIVASFIKRFARISISAPLPDIVILSRFIQNLLLRHPKLKYMVPLQSEELGSIHSEVMIRRDPFNNQETDPYKSGALLSTLWEMRVLQHHESATVISATLPLTNCNLPQHEWELNEIYELDEVQMFQTEINRENRTISSEARNNKSLMGNAGDNQMDKFWDLF